MKMGSTSYLLLCQLDHEKTSMQNIKKLKKDDATQAAIDRNEEVAKAVPRHEKLHDDAIDSAALLKRNEWKMKVIHIFFPLKEIYRYGRKDWNQTS
mgnify:CR=1 FL=1